MLKEFRTQMALLDGEERQLRNQELQLFNAVADEQARWSDFNARLDELERALTGR